MPRIVSVKPLDDYRLSIGFDDGNEGVISLRDRMFGPVFEPLRDPAQFRQVFVDEFGAIAWPNGADLAPDALHERLVGEVHRGHRKKGDGSNYSSAHPK